MKITKKTIIAVLFMLISIGGMAIERKSINFNHGWELTMGGKATTVDLPYDYQLNEPWDSTANRARGFKKQAEGYSVKLSLPTSHGRPHCTT